MKLLSKKKLFFRKYFFLTGLIGLVCVIVFDNVILGRTDIFAENWPVISSHYLVRSFIIFLSIIILFNSFFIRGKPKLRLFDNYKTPFEQISIIVAIIISVFIISLFLFKPAIFSEYSLEDAPIEWGSAILLFCCSILFVIALIRSRKKLNLPKLYRIALFLFSLIFFIMAMEEVSWMQRIFGFETPGLLKSNGQEEANLHNYATNFTENIYYFGTFFFLVFLPALKFLLPNLFKNNLLNIFIAPPFVCIIAAIPSAYNFDMWDIIFTQLSFFSSIIILFGFAFQSNNNREKFIILFTIILIIATQFFFIYYGSEFIRLWEVTEYKEFFIPLAFFIYTLYVFVFTEHHFKNKTLTTIT